MGSMIEPTPLTEMWMSHVQYCEHGRTVPIAHCHVMALGERLMSPTSMPEAGGRTDPEVIRAEELALSLVCCSFLERVPVPYLDNTVELAL